MSCQTIGSDTRVGLSVSSSEDGSDFGYGWSDIAANTSQELKHVGPEPIADSSTFPLGLQAPSGAQVIVDGGIGINDIDGSGTCWANFAGIA